MSKQQTKNAQPLVVEIQEKIASLHAVIDTIQLKGLSREQRQIRNITYDCIERAHAIARDVDPTNTADYALLWIDVNSLISTVYGAVEMLIDDFKDQETTGLGQVRQLTDETLVRIERLKAQAR